MKRLLLTSLKHLTLEQTSLPQETPGKKVLQVLGCAICRTDAKMWSQGQRDLALPRVLGHEMVVQGCSNSPDQSTDQQRFAVWPGQSCGQCRFCNQGQENLCQQMKILGFHQHGGFAEYVLVPERSLIPLPDDLEIEVACLAEPAGCAWHGINKLGLKPKEEVIIFGGGTLGLLCGLWCKELGTRPLIVEKDILKIEKARPFLNQTGIQCVQKTKRGNFTAGINACPDPAAFAHHLLKGDKASRFCFFSGLDKNTTVDSNIINLIHYKEINITGSYGLTRADLIRAVSFLNQYQHEISFLIEKKVSLKEVETVLPLVLAGSALRFVVDPHLPSKTINQAQGNDAENQAKPVVNPNCKKDTTMEIIKNITPTGTELLAAAQHKIDYKTKPLGALGRLEELAIQMSLIQGSLEPKIRQKNIFVFAGDHGVTEEGVSAFPSEVTAQMVLNFLSGGAAINVLCRHHNIEIKIVDMGVKADFNDHPDLLTKKVAKGTRNLALEEAMTKEQAWQGLKNGMEAFLQSYEHKPIDIVGLGEMGIGNTTPASAIISAITGISPEQATGRGTGIDNQGLEQKTKVIQRALELHHPNPKDGLDVLRKVGGFEIAGIAGAVLAAAAKRCAVVLDGVISTAAGLIAYQINPDIKGYLLAGHRSVEQAQQAALEHMGLRPLLDLDMRLGEGTGAALSIDLAEAACKIMCEMASFEEAGVSNRE